MYIVKISEYGGPCDIVAIFDNIEDAIKLGDTNSEYFIHQWEFLNDKYIEKICDCHFVNKCNRVCIYNKLKCI